MKTGERDASVDRLLPGVLKARAAEETGRECLDAETLAAWADDALSARERADAEAHAANCARCQTMLAAMIRTQPAPAAAVAVAVQDPRALVDGGVRAGRRSGSGLVCGAEPRAGAAIAER